MPAHCSRWPTFDFTEPIMQAPTRDSPGPKARVSAWISTGSPRVVAVPWHSTYPTESGATRAIAIASRAARVWPVAVDAV
jgi:hypothetical protein